MWQLVHGLSNRSDSLEQREPVGTWGLNQEACQLSGDKIASATIGQPFRHKATILYLRNWFVGDQIYDPPLCIIYQLFSSLFWYTIWQKIIPPNLREEELNWAQRVRGGPAARVEAAGHMTSTIREPRKVNTSVHLAFSFENGQWENLYELIRCDF